MSTTKQYKSIRKYKCPYCDRKDMRNELIKHVDKMHKDVMPEGYTGIRAVYDSINKTDHGTCMICKKAVYKWDEKHAKYANLCDDPKCREEVRRIALERHIKVYNKPTLLDDPEQQEKMLARRKISGKYKFTDGGIVTYTGSYEKKALEFIDKVLEYKSKEVQCPGPVLTYSYKGEDHNYISDIFIIPANLLIEVKDGGNNPNTRDMPEYREKQVAKEKMITSLGTMNYLRLTNNQFDQLLYILADIKRENMEGEENPNKIYHINEACGGGVPASCATIRIIPTEEIQNNGELGDFVFSNALEDDEAYEVTHDDRYKHVNRINKSSFLEDNNFHYMIECAYSKKLESMLFTKNNISLYDISECVSNRKIISLDEITLGLVEGVTIINNAFNNKETSYLHEGISNYFYYLSNKDLFLKEQVSDNVSIVNSPKGYFAITPSDYPMSTKIYSNQSDITESDIMALEKAYRNFCRRCE